LARNGLECEREREVADTNIQLCRGGEDIKLEHGGDGGGGSILRDARVLYLFL
jgi:hypothetical protein